MTAAYRLAQKGVRVALYERSPDLGGLVGSFDFDGYPSIASTTSSFRPTTAFAVWLRSSGLATGSAFARPRSASMTTGGSSR